MDRQPISSPLTQKVREEEQGRHVKSVSWIPGSEDSVGGGTMSERIGGGGLVWSKRASTDHNAGHNMNTQ